MGARRADEGCCPTCGLFQPCPTCGKTRLGLAPAPAERLEFTRIELNAAMRKAFDAGRSISVAWSPAEAEIVALLEDLSP